MMADLSELRRSKKNPVKICTIFIISLVAIGFGSSLCVIKELVPTSVEEAQPSSSGSWHVVESWSLALTTGVAAGETVVVFSIRPIDIYSYISSEDDDFQKGIVQYFLWLINKAKKKENPHHMPVWLCILWILRNEVHSIIDAGGMVGEMPR
jgi:hypothetical protein